MNAIMKPFGEKLREGLARLVVKQARLRWRRAGNCEETQARQFRFLCSGLARSKLGRASGVEESISYERFRDRIPVRNYESFSPYIDRVLKGEADVLWPGRCDSFAVSSGTTAGRTKYIPVTNAMLKHFRGAGLDSLLFYAARSGHSDAFAGRHLFLGGSTSLEQVKRGPGMPAAYCGDLSGIAAQHLPLWMERALYEPGRRIAGMSHWPAKIEAIAEKTLHSDIRMLSGIPSWILILADAILRRASREGMRAQCLLDVWPNLKCFVHGGVPICPFKRELARVLGPGVEFHEVYPASEGFIAAQDGRADEGLRLMADRGLFFEFVPVEVFRNENLGEMGTAALPLWGIKAGCDYVILLSTPAGLFRYLIGDVVRFVSTEIPHLEYTGRTQLQLSAFGEHVIEKELTDSLSAVAARMSLEIADFHVAPLFVDETQGRERGCHEWWLALRGEYRPDLEYDLIVQLDRELAQRNDDYDAKRKGGGLSLPVLRLVSPILFEDWMKERGKWGGQNKTPRCRSDRQIADALQKKLAVRIQPQPTTEPLVKTMRV
jgi:hypothetical protein